MNIFDSIIAQFYVWRYGNKIKYPANATAGYAIPHAWINKSKSEVISLAQQLIKNNLNCTEIEGESEFYDKWDDNTKKKMKEFVDIMKSYKMYTLISVIHGKGKLIKEWNEQKFSETIDWMQASLPKDYVVVNAVQEGQPGDSKAEKFYSISTSKWKGKTGYNGNGGTPRSFNNGFTYTLYHSERSSDVGSLGPEHRSWLDSDSPILIEWGYSESGNIDVNKCSSWMQNTLKSGRSCMVYLYRQSNVNKSLIEALGRTVKNVF